MPWRRSRVETRRRSFWPLEARESRRSRVVVKRIATVLPLIISISLYLRHFLAGDWMFGGRVALTIPFKPFLQLKELAEGRISVQA